MFVHDNAGVMLTKGMSFISSARRRNGEKVARTHFSVSRFDFFRKKGVAFVNEDLFDFRQSLAHFS